MERKTNVNAPVTFVLHSIYIITIIFPWLYKKCDLLKYVCISILRLLILQSIRDVQFEITAIQIFREGLHLKIFQKKVV